MKKKMTTKSKNQNSQSESTDNKDINQTQTDGNIGQDASDPNESSDDKKSKKTSNNKNDTDKEQAEVQQLEAKLAEMQDKYIRLSAEFDNYRRRTLREKMELTKYAEENLLLKIIPVMDDFERALMHMDTATECAAMKNGIDLIYGKFSEFFKQNGIKEIESLNADFNVDIHEAVAKVEVDDKKKKGKVVDVVLKGYYLQDKVIRFSKVIVGE